MAVSIFDAAKQVPSQTVSDTSALTNKFAPWFGEATFSPHVASGAYRYRSNTHMALPDTYAGRNDFMGTLVTNSIVNEDDFYTQVLLPIKSVAVEGGVPVRGISWNKWSFDAHFTDILPEETPATLITSRREEHSRAFARRGKAFELEHGFMETPEGREAYRHNLQQIIQAVSETTKYDVIYELLNIDVSERQWNARYGYVSAQSVDDAIEAEKERWAIIQKTKNGFEKMDADISMDMRKRRGKANTWVLHENMAVYLNLVRHEKTDFYMAGGKGPSRVNTFDATKPYGTLNAHTQVYLSRPFVVDKFNTTLDPWLRERQIGEYMLMASEYQGNADVSDYNTQEMCPKVYDEAIDDYAILSVQAAIENTILFDGVGRLRPPVKNYNAPNWEEDIKIDPFVKPSNPHGVSPIEVWGEMATSDLPTEGILRIANSAIRKLAERTEGGMSKLNQRLRDGLAVLAVISERMPSNEYFKAIAKDFETELYTNDDRYAKSNAINVVKVDPAVGTIPLPDLTDATKSAALVGYANWPGLLAARRALPEKKGYDTKELQAMADLATLLEEIVQMTRQLFPDSVFLDERFTTPQNKMKSAESVLLDNLLGMYQEAVWLKRDPQDPGADLDTRIKADDADLRANIKRIAEKLKLLNINSQSDTLFGSEADPQIGTAKFPLPKSQETGIQGANAKLARRIIVSELYNALNVWGDKTDIKGVQAFIDLLGRESDVNSILGYASSNYKIFQVDSKKAMDATIQRLQAEYVDAQKQDQIMGATQLGAFLYGNQADQWKVGIDYAGNAAALTYYRSPLTLSAKQILKRAQEPSIGITISAPGSNASRSATDAEVNILARKIAQVSNSTGLATIPSLSSLYMSRDTGDLGRTFIAHMIAGQQQEGVYREVEMREAHSKRLREGLEQRAAGRKRRRILDSGVRSTDVSEALAMYEDAGIGNDGEMMLHHIAQGTDVVSGMGLLREMHDRFGAQYRLVERSSESDLSKLFAKIFLGTPVTRQSLLAMARNNVVLPIVFMAARPHMRYQMRMGIKMQAGSETGNTFLGQSWFYLSDDNQKGMHHADYRYWSKSVVTDENNVYLAFDIFAQQGLGGSSVHPISLDEYDPAAGKFGRDNQESMFFIPLPYVAGNTKDNSRTSLPATLDLSGRFLHYKTIGRGMDRDGLMRVQYSTAARHNGQIGWRQTEHTGSIPLYDTSHPLRFDHNDTELFYNTTVCKAHQKNWSRETRQHTLSVRNTGHWGAITTPGCRAIRFGGYHELRDIEAY